MTDQRRVLITGATGFVGGHCAEIWRTNSRLQLFGLARQSRWPVELLHLADSVPMHAADWQDTQSMADTLAEIKPDWIVHLAGYAHVGRSFREPEAAWNGNLGLTRTLLTAIERWGGKPRLLHVSSGLVYGLSAGDTSCDETTTLRPDSPYAASKAAAEMAVLQAGVQPGIDIIIARPFNHTGPRQSAEFAVPNFARQIARMEAGEQAPILETGDLSSARDLCDVRDIVDAYWQLLQHGQSGEIYNVGRGETVTMDWVVKRLCRLARVEVTVQPKAERFRPSDTPVVKANIKKIQNTIGWSPKVSLDDMLQRMLDYYRGAAARCA